MADESVAAPEVVAAPDEVTRAGVRGLTDVDLLFDALAAIAEELDAHRVILDELLTGARELFATVDQVGGMMQGNGALRALMGRSRNG